MKPKTWKQFSAACAIALGLAILSGSGLLAANKVETRAPGSGLAASDLLPADGDVPAITGQTASSAESVGLMACPTITAPALGADSPDWPSTHGTQTGRLNRFTPAGTCAAPEACPGLTTTTGARTYDAYQFVNDTGALACVSVTVTTACLGSPTYLFTIAYLGTFDPASLCTNYLSDPGSSASPMVFSFNVPAGDTFTLVVHEVTPGAGCATGYTMTVTGIPCSTSVGIDSLTFTDVCSSLGPGSGDGIIDAGEDVTLSITAANGGVPPATGVTGTISTADPNVVISVPTATFPDLVLMAPAANNPPDFAFYIANTVPCGTVIPFTVDFMANEGTWTDTFDVTVGNPTTPGGTLINEAFEVWPLTGWTIQDNSGSGMPWGSGMGYACEANYTPGANGDWAEVNADCYGTGLTSTLITPAFDLSGATTAQLQFDMDIDDAYVTTIGTVDLSTDGGATWPNNLLTYQAGVNIPFTGTPTADLTPFVGNSNVKIRFYYVTNAWEWWWQVDDVVVSYTTPPTCNMNVCVGACSVTCSASAAPTSGIAPLAVTFTSTVATTGCVPTPTYFWDFGDGSTSTDANPAHTYMAGGTFTWTLTVTVGIEVCTSTGTITAAPYDMNFFDDYGRSRLCVNSTTGAFAWHVYTGTGIGIYTGVGRVTRTSGLFTLTNFPGAPWTLVFKFYTGYKRAYGSFIYKPARVFGSPMYDSNTTNDPPGC